MRKIVVNGNIEEDKIYLRYIRLILFQQQQQIMQRLNGNAEKNTFFNFPKD